MYGIAKDDSLQNVEDIDGAFRLQTIRVRHDQNHNFVTVIEVLSPHSKASPDRMEVYRSQRDRLIHETGTHVVEIDLTRSVKRLLHDPLLATYPYYVAVYIAGHTPHFISIEFIQSLPRIALPLLETVAPIDLQQAYTNAYQGVLIAQQMEDDRFYIADRLPFPSLLTETQQASALKRVAQWQSELKRLRG